MYLYLGKVGGTANLAEIIETLIYYYTTQYPLCLRRGGSVVTAQDWRPRGEGSNHAAVTLELWQFHLRRFASVFRRSH